MEIITATEAFNLAQRHAATANAKANHECDELLKKLDGEIRTACECPIMKGFLNTKLTINEQGTFELLKSKLEQAGYGVEFVGHSRSEPASNVWELKLIW